MGTDISLYAEHRRSPESKWEFLPPVDAGAGERYWWVDRNYRLFGMLANVRNGYGVAGFDTGDAVEPILPRPYVRGWPDDCSPELEQEYEDHAQYDHSHSWLGLWELLNYFESRCPEKLIVRGVVERSQFEEFERTGEKPSSWCTWVSGPGIKIGDPSDPEVTHVKLEWSVPTEVYTGDLQELLQKVLHTSGMGVENIRMVFSFNS